MRAVAGESSSASALRLRGGQRVKSPDFASLQIERINLIAEGTAAPVNIDGSMAMGPLISILSPTALGGGLIRQAPHNSNQSLGRSLLAASLTA